MIQFPSVSALDVFCMQGTDSMAESHGEGTTRLRAPANEQELVGEFCQPVRALEDDEGGGGRRARRTGESPWKDTTTRTGRETRLPATNQER
eukprot:748020-Hanusia_phi.AAC.1